ncbi:ABC transporter ATP-binding protein [Paenibacillus eucommiae]|uniref:Osmoprotectant transport system ATP-binding protein n=1 Tax=Paenibacillus eucommiae TaxID=1355755 RepID=A0ABS4J5R6_9BACL|nr:ABC transporter ATP-binding protein [Paenibacillus eucommiae]MBP1995180.1 osmoprotectant transport system ATP-binding protein [Paenibacillus eucommiae]
MNGIILKNVHKTFPGASRPAVNNVSLEVAEGQFTAIVGSSGCGKTTLLKMVNRLYEQTEGAILVNGKDTREVPVGELRRQIGYVIQQNGLFPHMTVEKNITVVPEMLGWDKPRMSSRVTELLELVHMDPKEFRGRYPRQLSGGQQQRVGLARALAADPHFMLMDEPFGAIDAITRTKLQDELIHIQKKLRKTILFVTHDVDEALRLADKIIVMKDGEVVQYDEPLALITNPVNEFVANLLGGDDIIRQLSLIPVTVAMEKLSPVTSIPPGTVTISSDTDLKSALAAMLKQNAEALYIVSGIGAVLGRLSLSHVQALLSAGKRKAELHE